MRAVRGAEAFPGAVCEIGSALRRVARAALRTLATAVLFWLAPALATTASEYQVKAVFLFNFSQFVEWSPQVLGAPDSPFAICILGKDRFGSTLEATVRGENVQGRPFVVRRYTKPGDIDPSCHILFISDSEAAQLERIVATLSERPLLTVSDIDGAAEQGAIIQFTNDHNRLRLRINVEAARAAGLVISSKLLRPAEIVGAVRG